MPVLTYGQQSTLTSFQQWLMQQGLQNCVVQQQKGISPPPPGGVLATNGDTLRFVLASSDGAHAIDIAGQAFPQQGGYSRIYQQITTNSDTSFKYVSQPAIDGYYGNFVASVPFGQSIDAPGVYVRAELARTISSTLVPYAVLFEGYVHNKQTVSMNGGGQTTSGGGGDGTTASSGGGCCPSTLTADVADFTSTVYTVPVAAGTNGRLVYLAGNVVTSGVAGNRTLNLQLNPAIGFGWFDTNTNVQTASQTKGYIWEIGGSVETVAGSGEFKRPLPETMWFSGDFTIELRLNNVQVGDTINNWDLTYEIKGP